jgi:hypothetical protein
MVISAQDVIFYEAAARKRILGLKLVIRAIDGSLYQAEAGQDIQMFIESETLFDVERTKYQTRHACLGGCCFIFCNILFCVVDPCCNPYPRSRTKEQVVLAFGAAKPYWKAPELLQMIAALEAGMEVLPQQGPERLQGAHAECDAQERMAWKRGPLALGMQNHSGLPPQDGHAPSSDSAAYNHSMQPASTMQEGPPKANMADQLGKLSQLKESGVLSQEQFDQAVAKVIAAG